MFDDYPFTSWSRLILGGIAFAMLFEMPLVMAGYLTEGTFSIDGSTLIFGAAAFLGYLFVGASIMRSTRTSDSG